MIYVEYLATYRDLTNLIPWPGGMLQKRFAILDRDGTLIFERNYLSDPDQVELIPGVSKGLRELSKLGLGLVVITNQSGVGRGYFSEETLNLIHQRLLDLLALEGVHLDGIYYCPHTPEDSCNCRKPKQRLVELAAAKLGFDPSDSFVIGDKRCDIDLGNNVGATTILVQTGYGNQVAAEVLRGVDFVARDVDDAARMIRESLNASGMEKGMSSETDFYSAANKNLLENAATKASDICVDSTAASTE